MTKLDVNRSPFGQMLFEGLQSLPANNRLSFEQLEVIYALAYTHFTQQQYKQALPMFEFLARYGATHKHYLIGLGLCLQRLERNDEAIQAFSMVIILFPNAADAALHIAECQILAAEKNEALKTLEGVVLMCNDDSELKTICTRARALVELLTRNDKPYLGQ